MTSTAEAALSRFRELLQIPTVSRTDESEIDWQPFDNFLAEAVEQLVADGFTPARDVYLSFGHNEETAGGGARAIVALLDERDIRPGLVLDEGGAVVDGAVPGVGVPTAMVGVAERGVMTLLMTARETGGTPPRPPRCPPRRVWRAGSTGCGGIRFPPASRARARDVRHAGAPRAAAFALGVRKPRTHWPPRRGRAAASGGRDECDDTVTGATERARRVVADPELEIEVRHGSDPSPVSPWRGEPWRRLAGAVRDALGNEVVTTPYIQLGASDSRWFTPISSHVYRFTPFHLARAERDGLHSHDERIRVDVWLRGIGFYRALIEAS